MVWENIYGGADGYSVKQTADGGYIIAGSTGSAGSTPLEGVREYIYIVKTDSDGNQVWSKIFAYPVLDPEAPGHVFNYCATFIDQTVDAGYIIVGSYEDSLHEDGACLIKIDAAGNIQFNQRLDGSPGSMREVAAAVKQTLDGGYIIVGTTKWDVSSAKDVFLLKTDSEGNAQWRKTFGGSGGEWGNDVVQTSDGGYAVVGTTWSFGPMPSASSQAPNIYLVKTNASGEMVWQRIFGGNYTEWASSLCATTDGGLVIGGSTASYGWGSLDAYLIKIDPSGNEQWSITIGGKYYEYLGSIQQTSDGGYVVAGEKVNTEMVIIYPYAGKTFETYLAYYYPEITPAPGAVEAFVKRFYQVFFNREPARQGLNGWVSDLSNGTISGMDIAYGFAHSSEFVEKNVNNQEYLEIIHNAFLDRDPDPAGLDGWLHALIDGTDRTQVLNGFIFSQEFAELCEEYGIKAFEGHITKAQREAVEAFVIRFYQLCLDRNPDAAGLEGWVNNLLNQIQTGAEVANGFIYSQEFINKNTTNDEYLTILYKAFFNREPDQAGWDVWITELNSGRDRGYILNGFLGSQEFIKLCEDYGIKPN